jgi:hypothetical protein
MVLLNPDDSGARAVLSNDEIRSGVELGVTIYVHPLDTEAHPLIPAGWRWAVHAGVTPPPDNLERCLNAGWTPNKSEACVEGEAVGVAVAKALAIYFGFAPNHVPYLLFELERDPIPPER